MLASVTSHTLPGYSLQASCGSLQLHQFADRLTLLEQILRPARWVQQRGCHRVDAEIVIERGDDLLEMDWTGHGITDYQNLRSRASPETTDYQNFMGWTSQGTTDYQNLLGRAGHEN